MNIKNTKMVSIAFTFIRIGILIVELFIKQFLIAQRLYIFVHHKNVKLCIN